MNRMESNGNNALMVAAKCGRADILKFILQNERHVNIAEYQGVKNFTLVARMQNSSSILRATDESSMF